jgi:hypothetical protein
MTLTRSLVALVALPAVLVAQAKTIKNLPASFGVPSSPAFELLGVKPDEVTHVATPRDFQSNQALFFDGKQLRSGIALDGRLTMLPIGSIEEYQTDPLRRLAWRSVFSFGTTDASKQSADLLIAGGLRIPLIDHADPRADKAYQDRLVAAALEALNAAPPPFGIGADSVQALLAAAVAARTKAVRDAQEKASWGKAKLDLGFGYSEKAKGASLDPDDLTMHKAGGWLAGSHSILGKALVTASAKAAWSHVDADTLETSRQNLGVRLGLTQTKVIRFSVEATGVRSRYDRTPALHESWGHYAAMLEFPALVVDGWLVVGWGGDGPHRTRDKNQISFSYALFKDRLLK